MENSVNNRCEVRISRWQAVTATILCLVPTIIATVSLYLLVYRGDSTAKTCMILLLPVLLTFVLMTVACASLWLRRRPLLVIDDNGITDGGFYSQGFGFISWENIENITPRWLGRSGLNLLMKVNNYDELIAKRHVLMQPFLMFSGFLNGFFDAQLLIMIGWGDADIETIREQISYHSKNKIQVPKPLSIFRSIFPMLAITAVILLGLGAIFVLCAVIYSFLPHR